MTTQRERGQKCYYNRKNNGLCPRCGKPLDREGHYCSECLEKVREYSRKNRVFYRENHLCIECGKVVVLQGERMCPECRAKMQNRKHPTEYQKDRMRKAVREHHKILYQQRSELGICTRCGKRKAMNGKKKCGICLAKDAEMHRRKSMDRPNIREYRENNHLCYFCGRAIDMPHGKLCKKCYEKCVENGKKSKSVNDFWKKDNNLIFGRR